MRIIAHRGASLDATENTLEAFALAKEQGADAIEIDVQPTADGHLAVFHDWDLERLCGRAGSIRSLRLDEVRALRTRDGQTVPTLPEVLATRERPDGIIVELKSRAWNDVLVAALAAKAIRASDAQERGPLVVSSFNPLCLLTLRRIAPVLPRAMLSARALALPFRRLWSRFAIGPRELHLEAAMITPGHLAQARRAGREVIAWTVNDPTEARRLDALGVVGLITDAPRAIREALAASAGGTASALAPADVGVADGVALDARSPR